MIKARSMCAVCCMSLFSAPHVGGRKPLAPAAATICAVVASGPQGQSESEGRPCEVLSSSRPPSMRAHARAPSRQQGAAASRTCLNVIVRLFALRCVQRTGAPCRGRAQLGGSAAGAGRLVMCHHAHCLPRAAECAACPCWQLRLPQSASHTFQVACLMPRHTC